MTVHTGPRGHGRSHLPFESPPPASVPRTHGRMCNTRVCGTTRVRRNTCVCAGTPTAARPCSPNDVLKYDRRGGQGRPAPPVRSRGHPAPGQRQCCGRPVLSRPRLLWSFLHLRDGPGAGRFTRHRGVWATPGCARPGHTRLPTELPPPARLRPAPPGSALPAEGRTRPGGLPRPCPAPPRLVCLSPGSSCTLSQSTVWGHVSTPLSRFGEIQPPPGKPAPATSLEKPGPQTRPAGTCAVHAPQMRHGAESRYSTVSS